MKVDLRNEDEPVKEDAAGTVKASDKADAKEETKEETAEAAAENGEKEE